MNFCRWRTTIQHVKQYKQIAESSVYIAGSLCDDAKSSDDLSVIMNIYADRLTKNRNGEGSAKKTKMPKEFHEFLISFYRRLHPFVLRERVEWGLSAADGKSHSHHVGDTANRGESQDKLFSVNSPNRWHRWHHHDALKPLDLTEYEISSSFLLLYGVKLWIKLWIKLYSI